MIYKLPFESKQLNIISDYAKKICEIPSDCDFTELKEIIDTEFSLTGKMLRPILVLSCTKLCGYEVTENIIEAAALTELVHMSSLIHDDIIDDAPLRRGRASVQSKYGKDMAVYAGDYILSRIMKSLVKENMHPIGGLYSDTMEKMCIGELGQKAAQYNLDTKLESYVKNINGKTAALFSCSCCVGAVLNGASKEEIDSLREYGKNIGLLFQLRDDLIDIVPSMQTEKKTLNSDFVNGIYTLPVLIAIQNGKLSEFVRIRDAEFDSEYFYNLLDECGALSKTIEIMTECADRAIESINSFPDSESKRFLISIPEKLMEFSIK